MNCWQLGAHQHEHEEMVRLASNHAPAFDWCKVVKQWLCFVLQDGSIAAGQASVSPSRASWNSLLKWGSRQLLFTKFETQPDQVYHNALCLTSQHLQSSLHASYNADRASGLHMHHAMHTIH